MTQEAIEALLRKKIGWDIAAIGASTIARAIRQRMIEGGLSDLQSYLMRLQTSPQELEALIESTIVPETWFFRDREPFNFLYQYVRSQWLPAHPNGVLRVLSVPCSTGEEPYSIAIALLSAGLAPTQFHIDAVDISKKSLLKAERAIYDKNSFRGDNLTLPFGKGGNFQEQYFVATVKGYQLCESVSRTVHFIYGNLLDSHFWNNKIPYDAIFCRNLFIYFDQPAREQTLQLLDRLLTPKGLLFVGHSETGQLLASRFVSIRHPLAFAYRKKEQKNSNIEQQLSKRELPIASHPLPIPTYQSPLYTLPTHHPLPEFLSPPSLLETARNLANRGCLDEAATLCQSYLSQNRMSAEAYFLLGEVRQAAGNEEQAEQCFYKVIYLQPNHCEALMHLALLKERHGDTASASVIRQRIQRMQKLSDHR